jgi:hypothetical protein
MGSIVSIIDRHAGGKDGVSPSPILVLSSKNPHAPNLFPGIQPTDGFFQFLSMFIDAHPWLRIVGSSVTLVMLETKGFQVI